MPYQQAEFVLDAWEILWDRAEGYLQAADFARVRGISVKSAKRRFYNVLVAIGRLDCNATFDIGSGGNHSSEASKVLFSRPVVMKALEGLVDAAALTIARQRADRTREASKAS